MFWQRGSFCTLHWIHKVVYFLLTKFSIPNGWSRNCCAIQLHQQQIPCQSEMWALYESLAARENLHILKMHKGYLRLPPLAHQDKLYGKQTAWTCISNKLTKWQSKPYIIILIQGFSILLMNWKTRNTQFYNSTKLHLTCEYSYLLYPQTFLVQGGESFQSRGYNIPLS